MKFEFVLIYSNYFPYILGNFVITPTKLDKQNIN
jgi:hypothetical protein